MTKQECINSGGKFVIDKQGRGKCLKCGDKGYMCFGEVIATSVPRNIKIKSIKKYIGIFKYCFGCPTLVSETFEYFRYRYISNDYDFYTDTNVEAIHARPASEYVNGGWFFSTFSNNIPDYYSSYFIKIYSVNPINGKETLVFSLSFKDIESRECTRYEDPRHLDSGVSCSFYFSVPSNYYLVQDIEKIGSYTYKVLVTMYEIVIFNA